MGAAEEQAHPIGGWGRRGEGRGWGEVRERWRWRDSGEVTSTRLDDLDSSHSSHSTLLFDYF